MAFVSGVSVGKHALATKGRVCDAARRPSERVARSSVVMKAENKDDDGEGEERRGFQLFVADINKNLLERAPAKVVGTTQDYTLGTTAQPGEYGYKDPLAKQKLQKARKIDPIVKETKEVKLGNAPVGNVQPGEYGYKDPIAARQEMMKASKKISTSGPKESIPEYLTSDQVSNAEDPYAGLPDYLRPLEPPKSTWSNV